MSTKIETKIDKVTVFRDGARVVRLGSVKVQAGEQKVIIPNITRFAHKDSFRVKGKGKASMRGIDVKEESKEFIPKEKLKELQDRLEDLERKRDNLDKELEYQQTRISRFTTLLSQFSPYFGKWFAAGETPLEKLIEIDSKTTKLILDAKKKIRDLTLEKEKLMSEIQTVQNEINRMHGQRKVEVLKEVEINLDVQEETEIELEITYQMNYASWAPTYDVDLLQEKAILKRFAIIQNNTLEDWKDVELSISTASAQPVRAVKANPLFIDVYQPYTAPASDYGGGLGAVEGGFDKEEEESSEEMLRTIDADIPAPEPELAVTRAEVSEGLGGIITYKVPGRVTIESDRDPHPVNLTEEEFESKKLYFWNAYAMPESVAQDEITNGESLILPGVAKVYSEGDFIGETNLGMISPREEFRLGTRTAYNIKAEKKLSSKDTEKAGLTRGKTKREYTYKIEIQSFAKEPIEIKVIDRIPHSSSERANVELKDISLQPTKNELGVIEWEVNIPTGEKYEIFYSFEVEWEKGLKIRPPLP